MQDVISDKLMQDEHSLGEEWKGVWGMFPNASFRQEEGHIWHTLTEYAGHSVLVLWGGYTSIHPTHLHRVECIR